MTKKLPTKLQKEPLTEAICELRIAGSIPLHNVVPGLLLHKYPRDFQGLRPTPAASIPEAIRASNPNLAYVTLVRFGWKNLNILVGNRVITISHEPPYQGWGHFKAQLSELFLALLDFNITPAIERYSIRYTNILKFDEEPNPETALDLGLKIGDLDIKARTVNLRFEVQNNNIITIVQLAQSATSQAEGRAPIQGLLVDIDSVSNEPPISCGDFLAQLDVRLENIRLINKSVFFECLRNEAIDALGASYAELH
jgi:uncharacterized protein (TIGR04255 family)